jgi:hypothetical protein
MQLEFEFMEDDKCTCNGKGCECHELDAIPADSLIEHNEYILKLREHETSFKD